MRLKLGLRSVRVAISPIRTTVCPFQTLHGRRLLALVRSQKKPKPLDYRKFPVSILFANVSAMPDLTANPPPAEASNKWRPLGAIDRRVLGVLVEKGKTTPDQYPMSLNALTAGCNQKSNRAPQMELDQEDVLKALDRLRGLGAVAEVQGGGRVPRYRHFAYEWLGVNKVELAVMAELLLRGSQTEGELRGRAARMEAIADLTALRPVLESLSAKNLIVSLSPPGRGHVLTHNLYEPHELAKERLLHAGGAHDDSAAGYESTPARGEHVLEHETARTMVNDRQSQTQSAMPMKPLVDELSALRDEIARLKADLSELTAAHARTADELRSVRDALGG